MLRNISQSLSIESLTHWRALRLPEGGEGRRVLSSGMRTRSVESWHISAQEVPVARVCHP